MFGNGIERMPRGKRTARIVKPRRGKSSVEGKRESIARRQARALKYGGQR